MLARVLRLLEQRFTLVVVGVALVQALVLVLLAPGVLSIDEVTYLAMARGAAAGHPLTVFVSRLGSSPELGSPLVHEVGGRLVAQYPAGYALLAAPFQLALGARGLFVGSTFSFFGAVLVTRRLATRALGHRRLGTLAAVILALGTFAWEYGAGLWPHALTMLLVTSALAASFEERPLAAGLITGLALTVRLDAMFLVPALVLVPALRQAPAASRRETIALVVGLAPGLAFLSVTNHLKFGTWMPLSYGPWHPGDSNTGAAAYAGLAVVGLIAIAVAQVVARRPALLRSRVTLALAVVALLVALVVPAARERLLRAGDGLLQLLVDLRFRELDAPESALSRSPRGAMIYVGTLKTSLAQSLPYLALVGLSVAGARQIPSQLRPRLALLAPFLAYLAVFSAMRWHGGLAVNLRYFVPVLPVFAILAADGLARLARAATRAMHPLRSADVVVLASLGVLLGGLAVLQLPSAGLATTEIVRLDVPLVVAGVLAAIVVAFVRAPRGEARARLAAAGHVLAVFALVMASLTELGYHAVAVGRVRMTGRRVAARAAREIPAGSLVVVDVPDRAALLLERGDVLATGSLDGYADVARLVTRAACAGQRSFALMRSESLERAARASAITVVEHEPPREGLVIAELTTRSSPCRP